VRISLHTLYDFPETGADRPWIALYYKIIHTGIEKDMQDLSLFLDENANKAKLLQHPYQKQEIWLDKSVIDYFKQTKYWRLDKSRLFRILEHYFLVNLSSKSWEISQNIPVKSDKAGYTLAALPHCVGGVIEYNERTNQIICKLQD
jgi:hypothetical protein